MLGEYESDLKLLEPLDPHTAVAHADVYTEGATLAVVESSWGAHEYQGQIEVRARRQMPQNFQVNMNLNLQLPPGMNPAQQQAVQQIGQALQQQILQQAQQAVQQAVQQQAPIVSIEAAIRSASWRYVP